MNAAVCVASATAVAVAGLLGPDGKDASGSARAMVKTVAAAVTGGRSGQEQVRSERGGRRRPDVPLARARLVAAPAQQCGQLLHGHAHLA